MLKILTLKYLSFQRNSFKMLYSKFFNEFFVIIFNSWDINYEYTNHSLSIPSSTHTKQTFF